MPGEEICPVKIPAFLRCVSVYPNRNQMIWFLARNRNQIDPFVFCLLDSSGRSTRLRLTKNCLPGLPIFHSYERYVFILLRKTSLTLAIYFFFYSVFYFYVFDRIFRCLTICLMFLWVSFLSVLSHCFHFVLIFTLPYRFSVYHNDKLL